MADTTWRRGVVSQRASGAPSGWQASSAHAKVRVGFVGGHKRVERQIIAVGERLGVDVEVHDGSTAGQGKARLIALVQRTHWVVIVTGTNSHNAVYIAKREAAKTGAQVLIVKACGGDTARVLLTEIARGAA
jgi:hypothetical protein